MIGWYLVAIIAGLAATVAGHPPLVALYAAGGAGAIALLVGLMIADARALWAWVRESTPAEGWTFRTEHRGGPRYHFDARRLPPRPLSDRARLGSLVLCVALFLGAALVR